jgi:hypothetical protein
MVMVVAAAAVVVVVITIFNQDRPIQPLAGLNGVLQKIYIGLH